MLKYLAIIAIAASVTIGASGQSSNAASNAAHNAAKELRQEASKKRPSTVVFQENYYQTPDHPQQVKPSPPKWYAPLERSDWWLVIVAALTGSVIGWQAIEIRRAAQAIRDLAKAAAAQNESRMERERARLSVIPAEPSILGGQSILGGRSDANEENAAMQIFIDIVNEGETKALNVSGWGYVETTAHDGFKGKTYAKTGPDLEIPRVIRAVDLEHPVRVSFTTNGSATSTAFPETVIREIQGETVVLEIIGKVTYDDVFGKLHQVPFHYAWQIQGKDAGGSWRDESCWVDLSSAST